MASLDRVEEEYFIRYPASPRNRESLTEVEARRHGFAFVGQEEYTYEVSFFLEELVNHMMSHSSVLGAIEEGPETAESVRRWLLDAQAPFFDRARGTFLFEGSIDYLRRESS